MSQVVIRNTVSSDAEAIHALTCLTYGYDPAHPGAYAVTPAAIRRQIRRFPEGQFVATVNGQVIGYTINLRTQRSPDAPALGWLDAVGGAMLNQHQPYGAWVYIADFAVHPDFRGLGIGKQLCQAWFNLAECLNLRGLYAGGLVVGYADHAGCLSIDDYGAAVRRGDLTDPTVTMYMKRGFEVGAVIKNYEGTSVHDHAMLIVWHNAAYRVAAA